MAILGNMILETCAAPGNSVTINLAGASSGFSTFRSQIANGATPSLMIRNATQWEVSEGVLTYGTPDTLARTTVLSNYLGTTARVNFIGSAHVYATVPAERAVVLTAVGGVTISGIMNAGSVLAIGGISAATGTLSGAMNIGGTLGVTGVVTAANGTTGSQVVNYSQFNPTVSGGTVNTLLPGGIRWQSKSETVTTDGSGNAIVTFPTAFGTSAPTVILSNGNATTTTITPSLVGQSSGAFQFNVPAWNSKSYTINWTALGAA